MAFGDDAPHESRTTIWTPSPESCRAGVLVHLLCARSGNGIDAAHHRDGGCDPSGQRRERFLTRNGGIYERSAIGIIARLPHKQLITHQLRKESGDYGNAKGFAKKAEGFGKWRHVARRRGLDYRCQHLCRFAHAWQYRLAGGRSDYVGGRLGLVGRTHSDGRLYGGSPMVDAGVGTNRRHDLSGLAQSPGHLDANPPAADDRTAPSVDARADAMLAPGPLAGSGGRRVADKRDATP